MRLTKLVTLSLVAAFAFMLTVTATDAQTTPPPEAASVSEGVWMYQLTNEGVAIEITAKARSTTKTTT